MQTEEFEWDDNKAASNVVKHQVSFADATFAFDDPFALDEYDERSAEPRYKWTGWNGQKLLVVIYAERGPRKRIISAREAEQHECDDYDFARGIG